MKALHFKLLGKTAFFKKPDVNVNTYFTYTNIHKVALLGLLGAILGLGGHNQQYRKIHEEKIESGYPEFYEKLKDLKVSIKPKGNGYFTKKIQVFNNGVGYASKEKGGNLVVREQWLENPEWDIYILDDSSIETQLFERLEDFMLNGKCVFMPYLGKNDHPAVISDCSIIDAQKVGTAEHIDSLFLTGYARPGKSTYDERQEQFLFREFVPCKLKEKYNYYEFEELYYTNLEIDKVYDSSSFYGFGEMVLSFI